MNSYPDAQKCDQCSGISYELFYCETCNCSGGELHLSRQLLCDVCLGPHVKRDHLITDISGNQPLICHDHKMLQQEYCQTCDTTFCWRCMNKHSEHRFDTLEKRRSDIRTEISQILSGLEKREKSQGDKKARLSKVIDNHRVEQLNLHQMIDKEIDKLRQRCSSAIGENSEVLQSELENLTQLIHETNDIQKKVHSLSISSNTHLLKQFRATQEQVQQNKVAHDRSIIRGDLLVGNCEIGQIANMFDNFGMELENYLKPQTTWLSQINSVFETYKKNQEFYATSHRDDRLMRVAVKDGQFNVEFAFDQIEETSDFNFKLLTAQEIEFDEKIEHCFVVLSRWDTHTILLLVTFNKKCFAYGLEKYSDLSKIALPSYDYLLCPYDISPTTRERKFSWCYWNDEKKMIKFTHNNHFSIKCDQFPSVRRNDAYSAHSLLFITNDNSVIYVDTLENVYRTIPVQHSFLRISCTTFFHDLLLVWCVNDNLVLVCTKKSNRFTPPVKHKLNTESLVIYIEVEGEKYRLLPGIRNETGEHTYLFKTYLDSSDSEEEDVVGVN